MASGRFYAVFDPDLYNKYQELVGKGNVASSFETYMTDVIAVKSKDVSNIDIEILNKQISRLKGRISKLQAELTNKVQIKEKYEQDRERKKQEVLELEKKKIEEAKTCDLCGNVIEDSSKIRDVWDSVVCSACYLAVPPMEMKQRLLKNE